MTARSDIFRAGPTAEFVDLCATLYGDAIDPDEVWNTVAKAGPDQADVNAHSSTTRQVLRGTALTGAALGGYLGLKEGHEGYRAAAGELGQARRTKAYKTPEGVKVPKGPKVARFNVGAAASKIRGGARLTRSTGVKLGVAGALIPMDALEVGVIGSDLRASHKKGQLVNKAYVPHRMPPMPPVRSGLGHRVPGLPGTPLKERGAATGLPTHQVRAGTSSRPLPSSRPTKIDFSGARPLQAQPKAAPRSVRNTIPNQGQNPEPYKAPNMGQGPSGRTPPIAAVAAGARSINAEIAGKLIPVAEAAPAAATRGKTAQAAYATSQALHTTVRTKEGRSGALVGAAALAGGSKLAKKPPANEGSDYYGGKSADVEWRGTFSKFEDDKQLAFGWASVSKVGGVPVIDKQGDYIDTEDIESAAYEYVLNSRVGGSNHGRDSFDRPVKVADIVESMVFTDDKVAKMGLPDDFNRGWWIGMKIHDEDEWEAVKKGGRTGFSIHGKGVRKDQDVDALMGYR